MAEIPVFLASFLTIPRDLPSTITITDPKERKRLLQQLQPCLKYFAGTKRPEIFEEMIPLMELPTALDPFSGFTLHRVPVLRCGFPLTRKNSHQLISKAGVPDEDVPKETEALSPGCVNAIIRFVSREIGWKVTVRTVFGNPESEAIITLHHNYMLRENYTPRNVIESAKALLQTNDEPQWYLDFWLANWDWHLK